MTDTIRPKIDAIAPAITGAGSRTLSDIYDALTAMALALDGRLDTIAQAVQPLDGRLDTIAQAVAPLDGRLDTIAQAVAPLDGRLDTIAQAVAPLDGRLEAANDWLDAIAAALGAAPYGDLELGSVRGFLSNIQATGGLISRAIGDTEPSEPYLAVRPYLAQIAQKASDSAASLAELETLQGTGNSLLGDINVSLGDGSDLISAIDTLIGEQGTQGDMTRQTVLDTSGSVRLDLVAVKDAVAGGASATVAEIITARDQTLGALDAQTASIEAAISASTTTLSGAISASTTTLSGAISASTTTLSGAIAAQTAAIDALFEEYVGTAYADGDPEPTSLNNWLARLDIKLSFVAQEFGWGT